MASPSREAEEELHRRGRIARILAFDFEVRKPATKGAPFIAVAIDRTTGKPIPEIEPVEFRPTITDQVSDFT